MWPEHVTRHAQDALRAAHSGAYPEWYIVEDDPMVRFAISAYLAQAHQIRLLNRDGDFEFAILTNLSKPVRWFSVRFADTTETHECVEV